MRALKQKDGRAFLGASLSRYGYLPLPERTDYPDLPVGFTVNGAGEAASMGMTCAACHTRQIEVGGTAYRIDGGPGIVDFQAFLTDLGDAVRAVLADEKAFADFAEEVGGDPGALRNNLQDWSSRYDLFMGRALPNPAWGPGRLDAVSMIFNRVSGLNIGHDGAVIVENIAVADAPTRYPFVWNAARQDKTQWLGFGANGNDILGLARNLGEVYGVFADARPKPAPGTLLDVDYLARNSANWEGLKELENYLDRIGPPKWPFALDQALAAQGRAVFERSADAGGCADCHGKQRGAFRSLIHSTWATPVQDVGTDTRACRVLDRTVATGVLEGAKIPVLERPMAAEAPAFDVLAMTVLGAIVQHSTGFVNEIEKELIGKALGDGVAGHERIGNRFAPLTEAFPVSDGNTPHPLTKQTEGCAFEARVLEGIWAAAPYLHNGSVPTLADLLEKPAKRPGSYMPGPVYDVQRVGIAREQTAFAHVIVTPGCDAKSSGSSRCGHDFGTDLSAADKRALLEYLKSL